MCAVATMKFSCSAFLLVMKFGSSAAIQNDRMQLVCYSISGIWVSAWGHKLCQGSSPAKVIVWVFMLLFGPFGEMGWKRGGKIGRWTQHIVVDIPIAFAITRKIQCSLHRTCICYNMQTYIVIPPTRTCCFMRNTSQITSLLHLMLQLYTN